MMNRNKGGEIKDRIKARHIGIALALAFIASIIFYLVERNALYSSISFVLVLLILKIYWSVRVRLKAAAELKKIEKSFPDFISLMASNLRAGMTIDHALLLSSRKEFAPLDAEIAFLGREIVAGKDISSALRETAKKINSPKITRVISLLISGLQSGGNLAVLLEETSSGMRERDFVEKKSASNVLMYVIFIFFAVAIGAPVLFGFSSVLVEILSSLLSGLPTQELSTGLPFTLTKISVSPKFILYFSLFFIIASDVFASFVLGLVSKGKEREGVRYLIPLTAVSVGAFFISRVFLLKYFVEFFG